jgi:hypothetical protein
MFETFRTWLSRWQEPVVWLPLLLLSIVVSFYVFPAFDPRTGLDGFGSIFGTQLAAFDAMAAGFLAWLFVEVYHYNPRDADERKLIDQAVHASSWHAVALFIWPQLLWFAIFCALLLYFRG